MVNMPIPDRYDVGGSKKMAIGFIFGVEYLKIARDERENVFLGWST